MGYQQQVIRNVRQMLQQFPVSTLRYLSQVFAPRSLLVKVCSECAELRIISVLRELFQHILLRTSFEQAQRSFIESGAGRKAKGWLVKLLQHEFQRFSSAAKAGTDGVRDAVFAGFCEDSTGVASLLATDFRQWCIQLPAENGLCLLSGVDAGLTVSKQNQISHGVTLQFLMVLRDSTGRGSVQFFAVGNREN